MVIKCKYDELVAVKALKPHPKNRNTHPAIQIERLSKIIAYQGVRAPIIVSRLSGHIVKGHGTLMALKELELKEIPVVYQDFEDEEQEYAFVQSDNAIALWAELDFSGINADLENLGPDLDLELLGLKNFMLDPSEKTVDQVNRGSEMSEWVNMPVFETANKEIKLTIFFQTELQRETWTQDHSVEITQKHSGQWASRL